MHVWQRFTTLLPVPSLAHIDVFQILQQALQTLGYPGVALFVMIESSGIPFPGETMLLLAAFYAAIDHQMSIVLIIISAALGAIIGDNIGFSVGRTGGKAFLTRYGRYLFLKPEHMDRAEQFFSKHGNKTVLLGRFIAVLRAWAAFLAGVHQMHWKTFFFYNMLGGILWAVLYGLLGYFAGRVFHDNFARVEHLAAIISWSLGSLIVLGVTIFVIRHYVRTRRMKQQ
ncbi:MAG TPA: DedA family protein [Ktedonobacteraceae bacterium]